MPIFYRPSRGVLQKKVLLEISQNLQENTFARVSFLIVAGLETLALWCFHVNFVKFLGTSFSTEHLWWLLLNEYSFSRYCYTHLRRRSLQQLTAKEEL